MGQPSQRLLTAAKGYGELGAKILVFVVATTHLLFFLNAKEVLSVQGGGHQTIHDPRSGFQYYNPIEMSYLFVTRGRTEQLKYC